MASFQDVKRELQKAMSELPLLIGNEVVNHAQDKFDDGKGEFDGVKWEAPKRKNFTNTARQARAATRATLVGSGRLRNSIRIISSSATSVRVGSDVVYARVHNEGLKAGRGAGFTMPKRTFLGIEPSLSEKVIRLVRRRIDRALS